MLKFIGIRWFCLGLIVLALLSGSALSWTTSRELTDSSDDITLPLLPSTTSSQVALPTTTLGRSTTSINIGIEKTLVRRRSKKSTSSTSSSLRSTSKSSSSSSKSISTSRTPSLSPSKATVLSTTSTSLKTSTSNASSKTQTSSTVQTSQTSHPSSLSSSTSKGSQSTISSSPIKTVTGSSSLSLSRSSSSTFTSTSRLSIITTNPSPTLTSSSHSKITSTLSSSTTASSASLVSGSSQTYSFTTASATSCPDFYGFSSWNLLSLNTSDTGYRYGLYGLRDANGFLQYVGYFAVWTVSDVESDPDIVFDVSTPGVVRTIYPNGTNVLMDSTQGIVTISDCTDQFTFQLSGSTNPSKRSKSTSNQTSASELDHRAKLGLLPITITSKNECGSFDPVPPNIHCFDSTPGIPFPDHGAYVWNGASVSPGTFTATCSFTPPNYNLATSFSCTQAYPAIDSICTTSNKFNPDGSPYSFSTLCVNVAEQTQSKILMTLCVLADPVNFLCQAIKAYTGGMGTDSLREGLCGVTAQHTYITVSISDSSNPNSAETVIAQVSSDNPTPITYQYQRKPSISNFKCTPCSVNPSGAGTSQLFIGPWETVYSGGLSLSFGCQGTSQSYLWSAPVSAGSISDAAAQCQAIAENLSGASFSAEFDTMTWTDPSYTSTPASCAVFQCAMAADAFKIDLTYQDSSTFTIVPEAIGVK